MTTSSPYDDILKLVLSAHPTSVWVAEITDPTVPKIKGALDKAIRAMPERFFGGKRYAIAFDTHKGVATEAYPDGEGIYFKLKRLDSFESET